MDVYQAVDLGIRNSVKFFLLFQQKFTSGSIGAKDKLPLLLRCGGIIHYTRSGRSTVVGSEDFNLVEGDFLLVASECSSGRAQVIPTSFVPADYAFIMGLSPFHAVANEYMGRRPSTAVIYPCSSFESLLQTLCSGRQVTTPIRNVVIVSHARGEGMIQFPLNDGDTVRTTYLDQLSVFVDSTTRTTITDRVVRNNADTNIYIRGCNIGKEPRYLRLLKTIFGGSVTVSAPKHYDTLGNFFHTGANIDIRFEYMEYEFTVRTKRRLTTKQALVQLFIDQHLSDIHGHPIPDDRWNAWIPTDIRAASVNEVYDCTNPVHEAMGRQITREFRYQHRKIYDFTIRYRTGVTVPKTEADRLDALLEQLDALPEFQEKYPSARCPSPRYERWGYGSLKKMIDELAWTIVWSSKKRTMSFTGFRHDFLLSIPITDTDGRLMINALPIDGARQYLRHDIMETDNRFFTRV